MSFHELGRKPIIQLGFFPPPSYICNLMIKKPHIHPLAAMIYLMTLLLLIESASSTKGSVSLWSNSDCGSGDTSSFGERNPVALNYALAIDVCGTPGATVHSYKINQRPTCANGTDALFAFYRGDGCRSKGDGSAYNAVHSADEGVDGECLALVTFDSVAFLCDGVGVGGQVEISTSSAFSKATATAASSSAGGSASSVTNVLTTSGATAYYPLSAGSSPAAFSGSHGNASSTVGGSLTHNAGSATPSVSVFTGAGFRLGVPLVGISTVVGILVLSFL